MGDIQGGGAGDEQPVHRVSVKKFAMGRYEVTMNGLVCGCAGFDVRLFSTTD
jgi:hypothetical protein